MHSISMEELLKVNDGIIIDIRSNNKYNYNHVANAINIPEIYLTLYPERYLDKNKKYYLYCDNGIRSREVVSSLINLGYNCVNIEGGFSNYLFVK